MESVSKKLREKVANIKELNITQEIFQKENKEKKNWTAPGINGIQNFQRKNLKQKRRVLRELLNEHLSDGFQEELCSSPNLTDEKRYRPKTCLNTSYKLRIGLVGKYIREHTMENATWDKRQLGAVLGAQGTVDQLIRDR